VFVGVWVGVFVCVPGIIILHTCKGTQIADLKCTLKVRQKCKQNAKKKNKKQKQLHFIL